MLTLSQISRHMRERAGELPTLIFWVIIVLYKAFHIKLERLEKLCRALQTERNELSEKVEVLKEQVSGRAAGGGPAPPRAQPCAAPASAEEPSAAWQSTARVSPEAESLGAGPSIESVD